MNETILKFGYPNTLLKEYEHWVVLLRPVQATLGALILACKDPATAFAEITPDAFSEFGAVVKDVEAALAANFDYQKLNYLMLMMVDPDVHFHLLPRYQADQTFAETPFVDPGWPGPPNIGHNNEVDEAVFSQLKDTLKAALA